MSKKKFTAPCIVANIETLRVPQVCAVLNALGRKRCENRGLNKPCGILCWDNNYMPVDTEIWRSMVYESPYTNNLPQINGEVIRSVIGTHNEDLFIAIAAMNDTNDYGQYFVNDSMSSFIGDNSGVYPPGYHKATIDELITLFGDRNIRDDRIKDR